jgi:biotin transport system substrate-specific component
MQSQTLYRENTSVRTRVIGILLFAVATAISARLSALVPNSPVPLTMQVLVVVLSGLVLGPRDGLLAQVLYLQAILAGAPLTAAGLAGPLAFAAPTAGYLVSFPLAALVAGWLGQRAGATAWLWRALGGLAALVVVYSLGTAWLAGYVGGLGNAWALGAVPFVGADLLKVLIATAGLSLRSR